MVHKVISKYGLATHLALLASLPYVLSFFCSARTTAVVLLWVSAFAILWILAEPSILAGEHLSSARARVRAGMLRDPFFWFAVLAVAFTGVRALNGGIVLAYDAEKNAWAVAAPALAWFPGVRGDAGFLPFATTLGVCTVVLGLRHAVGLGARISFGMTASFVAGGGALAAVVCVCGEQPGFVNLATRGFMGGVHLGVPSGIWLIAALACGVQAESRKWSGARLPFCLAVAGNAAGVLFFLPPLLSALCFALAALTGVFGCVRLVRSVSKVAVFRYLTLVALGSALPFLALSSLAPDAVRAAKSGGFDTAAVFPEIYRQTAEALSRISTAMWKASPWCGAGLGAYGLRLPFLADKADWAVLTPGVSSALNGYQMLLAERGILGCAVFGVGLLLMLFTWGRRLVEAALWLRERDEGAPFVFTVPPVVWTMPLVLAVFGADAWFAPAFSAPASVFACAAALALAAASFPRKPRPEQDSISKGDN